MVKPEEFSRLGMYGRKDIFERRLNESYSEVAFGGGDWVNNQKIVGLFVFYHPNGKIATLEHPKFDDGYHTIRGQPYEAEYNNKKFEKHLKKFQLKVGTKTDLAKIVNQWEN